MLFDCFGMLQVRENEISLRNSSGGPEYLGIQREHCWRFNENGRTQNALSFLHYKGNAPSSGHNHQKKVSFAAIDKTCQHHLETRAANVWVGVQSDQ